MSDITLSSLAAIKVKIRKLTRSLSTAQLSDADINDYINQFVLYDLGAHLRLFPLKTNLTFYTQANIDTYSTNTTNPADPLYNFNNKYYSVHPPIFIAGYQQMVTQSQEEFYTYYPKISSINLLALGDGLQTLFTGFIPANVNNATPGVTSGIPFQQNNVLFESVDVNNNSLTLIDYPISVDTGALGLPGTNQTLPSPFGQVNYLTGQYTVQFLTAPRNGQAVNAQTYPYVPAIPQSVLYFNDSFILRPIPDQPYPVTIQTYIRPTEFLATNPNQLPELAQWGQLIAYGAAKKVFEDRMDMESIQMIMPEYKKQETLVLRTTIMQNSNQRSQTIYTQEKSWGPMNGFWPGGGGFGFN
jgi:hypothetical protein